MAKRIIVPIDAHGKAEAVVPLVAGIARDTGGIVRLVRVAPVPRHVEAEDGRVIAYADQEMARVTSESEDDLRRMETALAGVPTESVVRFGDPVEEILLEAAAFDADLIALAGARRGRLRAAVAPGVAERVAARADVPVLVLRS